MAYLSVTTTAITTVLIGAFYHYVIYPYFISPLSKIPNAHFTSQITSAWISRRRKAGTEIQTIYSLHQKHGPVVQLGPGELSVNSTGGLRTIYTGGFDKDAWYQGVFVNFGTDNLVSTIHYKPHSMQKRLLSHVYSKSFLQSSPDLQQISSILVFDRFLPVVQQLAQSKRAINVLPLTQAVGMDFTSSYLFGSARGTDFIRDVQRRDHILGLYEAFKMSLPKERAFGEFEQWCLELCDKTSRELEEGTTSGTAPVVYEQFYRKLEKKPGDLRSRRIVIASEMLDHLIAGHETSGITFTYIMWQLSQRPGMQARLREELLTLNPPLKYSSRNKTGALPSALSVDNLPLLDAVVRETLRFHAAVPGPLPRITPVSLTTIEGYNNIPGGTRVSSSAYSLHRIAEVFPRPTEWLPQRWIDPQSKMDDMRRLFWAFGSGGRMCLGSSFALQGMVYSQVY